MKKTLMIMMFLLMGVGNMAYADEKKIDVIEMMSSYNKYDFTVKSPKNFKSYFELTDEQYKKMNRLHERVTEYFVVSDSIEDYAELKRYNETVCLYMLSQARMILDAQQYRKYVFMLNTTIRHRGIEVD